MRRLAVLAMAVAFMAIPARATADTDLVALVDPLTGRWELGPDESFFFGVPGDVPFLGDWDGDGIDTPGLYRPSDGFAYVINRRETGPADASWFMGIPGDVPIVGDWDGDGIDTFSVYRPTEGKVYISNLNETGPARFDYYFGVPGDKPFAIDFDADGTSEVALHRESTGLVYMTDGPDGGAVAPTDLEFFWGIADDAVFAGDWDGSGEQTPGLIRPDRARAFLRLENTEGFADRAWPINHPGWLPVVGNVAGAPFRFDVEMTGSEVVPGPGQAAAGTAMLSVSVGGEICFSLEAPAVAGVASIAVYEGAPGEVGSLTANLPVSGSFGCATASPTAALALVDRPEDHYLQVTSAQHPAGAIRGQVAEHRGWDLALVGANVTGLGDADGYATLRLDVSTSGEICFDNLQTQRIGTVESVGVYRAPAGEDGPSVAVLSAAAGCTIVTPTTASMLLALPAEHYVQATTGQYPDGAVRAQLTSRS
ncbi:MAG: CHRD domain-containing protein [Acidimicrobiia bacterium]|nr:CHRD domain-containing protein [Acidimicrobiia bacterium]MBT8217967.1 CHRD domain-containing protein [Acidimicrobiia bacterium]NNF11327.1 CHRD domain-containing protein [Acidimicrobiia bacterium]